VRVAWAAWVQGLLGLAKAALFITLAVVIVQQVYFGPNRLAAARSDVVNRFEQERKTRVIALIHRQETVSVFGVPVSSHRHRRLRGSAARHQVRRRASPSMSSCTPWRPGPCRRARQAPGAQGQGDGLRAPLRHVRRHHRRIAADEIIMDANAVLGPVDPQIGDMPAGSIVRMVEIKGPANVSDQMLVLADVAQKARIQVAYFVSQILLRKGYPQKKAIGIATVLSEGRWTHDFPILVQREGAGPARDDGHAAHGLRPDGPLSAGRQGQAVRALRPSPARPEHVWPAAAAAGPPAVGCRRALRPWPRPP
jgi:hypothetical protein